MPPSPLAFRALGLATLLLLGGCASAPPPPHVSYPSSYRLRVGDKQALVAYSALSPNVTAAQPVTVVPRVPLYYQVVSPVAVTVYGYQQNPDASRELIAQMRGTSFNGTVTPTAATAEFAFATSDSASSGTVQLTISDKPLPPAPRPTQ